MCVFDARCESDGGRPTGMKLKFVQLFVLMMAVSAVCSCWKSEVRASRNSRPVDPVPVSTATPPRTDVKGPNEERDKPPADEPNAPETPSGKKGFRANLPGGFQMPTDQVGLKLLSEYGSICVAAGGATPPNKVLFRDETEVAAFHASLKKSRENIGGFDLELQAPAMEALQKAIAEASRSGASITPRAADSAKRTYTDTVNLWSSRVNPGLGYWSGKGRISAGEAARIKALQPFEQVSEILKLEAQGMYFSKDFSKSILYSVAAPGASQHIFMLALDVQQYADPKVREILARHGWFQTVQSDLPHFTYLGVAENELAGKGLKPVVVSGQKFWVPDLQS
jgi:hypothetical protein